METMRHCNLLAASLVLSLLAALPMRLVEGPPSGEHGRPCVRDNRQAKRHRNDLIYGLGDAGDKSHGPLVQNA